MSLEMAAWLSCARAGCRVLGVEIDPSAVPVHTQPFSGNTAFMLGNEVRGNTQPPGPPPLPCNLDLARPWQGVPHILQLVCVSLDTGRRCHRPADTGKACARPVQGLCKACHGVNNSRLTEMQYMQHKAL
jgi:hypothetical protein